MSRDSSIDILKGISILSIMLLHFEQGLFPGRLNSWLGNFMITAFYFTSGWVQSYKPDFSFKELAKKRWLTLGIPYIYYSGLLIVVSIVFWGMGHYDSRIVLRDIYKTITFRGIGTLWFLPALFGGELLAWKFRHIGLCKRTFLIFTTLIVISIYSYWNRKYAHLDDMWRVLDSPFRVLRDTMGAWYVIVIGYYLGKSYQFELAEMSLVKKIFLAFVVLILYTLIIFEYLGISVYLVSTIGAFGMFLFSQCIKGLVSFKWLEWFGRNSLIIMATHYSIIQEICVYINRRYLTGSEQLEGWSSLAFFIISLLIEVLLIVCISKIKKYRIRSVCIR